MRLIDADALKEKLQSLAYDDWNQGVQTFWADAFNECSDMVEEMPTIEPEPHWIPVTERLPEAGSWAIWCSNKGIIQVARWKMDAIDHFFPDQGFFQLDDAVAWMPLPEPYREDGSCHEPST